MAFLILEKEYDAPFTPEAHDAEAERLDPCLTAHGVRWIRSYLSLDRRRMICEFEADDAEAVRSACRSASVPFARVWTAEQYFPGGGAHGSWLERRRAREAASAGAR
jgi:hypothetical protein